MITTVHDIPRAHASQKVRPNCRSLAERRNKENRAENGVCVASPSNHSQHQSHHFSRFVVRRATGPRSSKLRGQCFWLSCITRSSKKCPAAQHQTFGAKILNLSRGQCPGRSDRDNGPTATKTGRQPVGALFAETRLHVETNLTLKRFAP